MIETFVVPDSLAGERVDRAVAFLTGWTRSDVQALVDSGHVLVGGKPVAKSRRLTAGDEVAVTGEPVVVDVRPRPEDIALDIRYADADLVVLVKPAGLVVHPGAGHEHGTMVSGLLAAFPDLAEVGDPARPGIVHRLDRDTSGLMLVARSIPAYDALVAALQTRAIERRYLALVWGRLTSRRGVIDAPIGRSTTARTRMAVRQAGKEARTGYDVLEEFAEPETTLLECRLETGRTHQIRVHLSAIGHPVVGDSVYGGRRPGLAIDRPFLHAFSLILAHPVTGEPLTFTDPLPADLEAIRERLATA